MVSLLVCFHLTQMFCVGSQVAPVWSNAEGFVMSFGSYASSPVLSATAAPSFNVNTLTDKSSNYAEGKTFIQNVAKDASNSDLGDRPLAAKLYVRFGGSTGYRSEASIYNLIRRARNRFAK